MNSYDNYDLLEFFPRRYQKQRTQLTNVGKEITSLRRQTQLLAMKEKILRELHWEKEQMKAYIRPWEADRAHLVAPHSPKNFKESMD